jgi:hypothetical protein
MLGRVVALLALPMAALLAQAPLQVSISAPKGAAFLIRTSEDTSHSARAPIVLNGTAQMTVRGTIAIWAADSTGTVQVEASDEGRVVASAVGTYVVVSRDSTGRVTIEAQSRMPAVRESFRYSKRRVRP